MKKVVSLLLVLVLALGMSTVAFAARDIDKQQGVIGFANGYTIKGEGFDGYWDYNDDVYPGFEQGFWLDQGMFPFGEGDWEVESVATAGESTMVTKADVNKSKLTIRTKIQKGPTVLKEVRLEYTKETLKSRTFQKAAVVWEFVKPFKSNNVDGVDFDFTVYPVIDGKAWTDAGLQVTGTLVNPVEEIDGDTYYIDMEPGTIGDVVEYSKSVEYDLGEGVSLFGRAIKGAKYWGVANQDATVKEDEMMSEKGIDVVYHLDVIGLANITNYVLLHEADPTSYVYDKNFKYLGKANDQLPFADTYYLANSMLDEDDEPDDDDDDFDDDDIPVAPPITGGDGYPVENENDNPSTGK